MKRTDRLASKKYGIMVHYLHGMQNGKHSPNNPLPAPTDWDGCVRDFDVDAFAAAVHRSGAGYVFFTLCQVSAYICAPSAVFDEITGGGCVGASTTRDLPMELAHALAKYDIDLYLYFTGDGPQGDCVAAEKFGTLNLTGNRVTEEFVIKWASVMREFAVRYGSLVKGWWIDAGFDYIGYTDDLLKYYKDAALAGNPDAVIAFNNGVVRLDFDDPDVISLSDGETRMDKAIDIINAKALAGDRLAAEVIHRYDTPKKYRYSIHDDYTAGEASYYNEIPTTGEVDGCLWQVMSFLGHSYCMPLYGVICGWGRPGCRYSAEYIRDYTNAVNSAGGVVTYDVCVNRFGEIDEGQLSVLSKIKNQDP